MRSMRNVVFSLLLAFATLAFGQGLELRLESDVREKLPGIPVPLRLVAVNHTTSEIGLPGTVFFHASRGGAESFLGGWSTPWRNLPPGDLGDYPDWDFRLRLAPGATLVADLPVSWTCDDPSFLLDPFVWPAGSYSIRVVASPQRVALEKAMIKGTLQAVEETVPELTVSAPLTIDVREPEGVDAEAWNYLLEKSHGKGWMGLGSPFDHRFLYARELRQRYPTSQYTRCFGATFLREDGMATIEELAARLRAVTPRPPMLDWVEFDIAGRHSVACDRHLRVPRNVPAAIEECETARALFEQIIDTTENVEVRTKAVESQQRTMTADQIRNDVLHREAIEAGTYQRIRPQLQCVKETGKSLEVRFSYNNPNAFIVYIGAGLRNFFTPGPEDRGQPTKFLPGLHEDVLRIEIEGKKKDPQRALAWTVEDNAVSAPADGTPKCKGK